MKEKEKKSLNIKYKQKIYNKKKKKALQKIS